MEGVCTSFGDFSNIKDKLVDFWIHKIKDSLQAFCIEDFISD